MPPDALIWWRAARLMPIFDKKGTCCDPLFGPRVHIVVYKILHGTGYFQKIHLLSYNSANGGCVNDLSQGVPHNRPGVALLLKDLRGGGAIDDKKGGEGGGEKEQTRKRRKGKKEENQRAVWTKSSGRKTIASAATNGFEQNAPLHDKANLEEAPFVSIFWSNFGCNCLDCFRFVSVNVHFEQNTLHWLHDKANKWER